jgi:hypothetical protein
VITLVNRKKIAIDTQSFHALQHIQYIVTTKDHRAEGNPEHKVL